jgi:chitinase
VLGFVVDATGSACDASWGGYYPVETGPVSWDSDGKYTLYEEIAGLRALGGDVVVSFGGASGTPLAAACPDVASLTAQYRRVIDTLGVDEIDFDVEGAWLADPVSVQRRAEAAAALQADLPSLAVVLTLPVLPSGLTPDGVAVIEQFVAAGVDLAGVNVMAMDYGAGAAPDPEGNMGAYAIAAATETRGQLALVLGLPADTLSGRIGVTPMIGMNDVTTEVFTLDDAAEVAAWAAAEGIGRVSMWSLNRDHPCPDQDWVGLDCSSSPDQVTDYAFTAAFLYGG